jgi:hypothetical protein
MKQIRKSELQKQEALKLLLKLKAKLPRTNIFGDDNHKLIDLQIEVLEGRILESHIHSYGDGIASQLLDVIEWKRGENESWYIDLMSEFDD